MSQQEPQITKIAIFTLDQLGQLRSEFATANLNSSTVSTNLIDQLGNQHMVLMEEIKKLWDENTVLNTQLKVAELEIKKLKEKSKKSNKPTQNDVSIPPNPTQTSPN